MINRGMVAALTISVVAHALLLGTAEWPWPASNQADELPVMEARLVAPPMPVKLASLQPEPPPLPKAPAPKLVPKAPPKPRVEAVARPRPAPAEALAPVDMGEPTMLPAPGETVLEAGPVSGPTAEPASAAVQPVLAAADEGETYSSEGWPTHGGIVFRVAMGEGAFVVGEAVHEWSHDDSRYTMQVTLQTTGLAGLVRGFHYVQRSEGELGPQGLKPQRFQVEQRGKAPESAEFDWAAGRVSIRRGERERRAADIRPGDQDVLSLWHQIGIVGLSGLPTTLTVASNKDAKVALLERVGEETLRLPIGRLETLRLRAQAEDGKLTIDIWLARNYGMLPVRIRMVDDKGEVLDQQAIRLRLAPPDEGDAPKPAGQAEMIELKEEADPLASLPQN
ncbi:hypothetical protein CJ010_19295 [Azoarcus sp. DD4]|uniref:DUF3108 domain-containing protein n=1 Tax=Azoarcus sp. DD4 TaxID=2027405 RepID=UPI001128D9AE|nr:DUF3108 domain-containing protein [Azoarcus sp. DD4]QDF98529.1 hypothetical protein CJ010_19295 [Azoarcus sp. DD4]